MENNYVIIMAGGIGSRYWPVSRSSRPKQFIDILGTGKSLIRHTYERFARKYKPENIWVVTNEQYRGLVKEQIPEMADMQILGEPSGKNTAPCIAYATYRIKQIDPKATCMVVPSDHLIMDETLFLECMEIAREFATEEEAFVTLGIKPTRPDTGYGYIQYLEEEKSPNVHKVKTFTEKPDLELAKTFLASGDFVWNGGIFVFRASTMKTAFEKYLPDLHNLFKQGKGLYNTADEAGFITKIYPQCPSVSIDYGIMEKADNVYTIPASFGWSDLGTWNSIYDTMDKDASGNAVVGKKVKLFECNGNVLNMPHDKLVIMKGVDNLIVVEKDNILLICDKDLEQEIKQVVTDIKLEFGEKYA